MEYNAAFYTPYSIAELIEAVMAVGYHLGTRGASLDDLENCSEELFHAALGNGMEDDFGVPPLLLSRRWRQVADKVLADCGYEEQHRAEIDPIGFVRNHPHLMRSYFNCR